MIVYKACVLSTLLYGSKSLATYAHPEKTLQVFHLRCLRRFLGIKWQDKITNNDVLSKPGLPSMFTMWRQRRLRWLGHVHRMENGRIPKDFLYGELAAGTRNRGRPQLRFTKMLSWGMCGMQNSARLVRSHSKQRSYLEAASSNRLRRGWGCTTSTERPKASQTKRQPQPEWHSRGGISFHMPEL